MFFKKVLIILTIKHDTLKGKCNIKRSRNLIVMFVGQVFKYNKDNYLIMHTRQQFHDFRIAHFLVEYFGLDLEI